MNLWFYSVDTQQRVSLLEAPAVPQIGDMISLSFGSVSALTLPEDSDSRWRVVNVIWVIDRDPSSLDNPKHLDTRKAHIGNNPASLSHIEVWLEETK